jgi:hypothetical protein
MSIQYRKPLLSMLALMLSQTLSAASFTTFENKAAFLAATGATNATGPLPNLGGVANSLNPTGSATVGSITFSLAPGGDNFSIGSAPDPDIYPQTPGNDISFGFENLRVKTAAPVFALGFEMVEPSAVTLSEGGGTPIPSTYRPGSSTSPCPKPMSFPSSVCKATLPSMRHGSSM